MDHKTRKVCDWVVLELNLLKGDNRTKSKALKCNFDYNFDQEKEKMIKIAGYPDPRKDF